jgi:pheromone shutdown-related protein TraB
MADNIRDIVMRDRTVRLVGTAHISAESVDEVKRVIAEDSPDRVCVEIDAGRFKAMTEKRNWESIDIRRILKEGKGFLLLANLVLSSFQRRLGAVLSISPGEEMKAAVEAADAAGIPYSFCDREIQVTLRRAWGRSNLWNKAKLIAALLSSAFDRSELTAEQIEQLKSRSVLDDMMGELAKELPSVKEVLIDERDRYLAAKILEAPGSKVVAVVGAGHMNGIEAWLLKMDRGEVGVSVGDIEVVPPKSKLTGLLGFVVPALLLALVVLGFVKSGAALSFSLLGKWILIHGVAAAIGSLLALGSPLTILASFIGSPVVVLKPFVSIGLVAAYVEAVVRKPQVADFENLNDDILSLRGFYRNKITRILLVFFFASLGGAIGNFISLATLGAKVL